MSLRYHSYLCLLLGLLLAATAQGQTNLLPNGSFELDANGKVFPNGASSSGWRWFAVNDTTGTAIVRSAAASQGAVGLELVRGTVGTPGVADTAIDKFVDAAKVPAEARVYNYLLDAKDGGAYGSTDAALIQMQFPAPTGSPVMQFDPGADWETWGITGASGSAGEVSVRASLLAGDSSMLIDNLRLYDVTTTNRAINPGFEDSATQPVSWRVFSTAAGALAGTLVGDAHSGARALQIERFNTDGDAGADNFGLKTPVIPGEHISFGVWAKKVSGDANTRLCVIAAEYDENGAFTGFQAVNFFTPGATWQKFQGQIAVSATARFLAVSYRVGNSSGALQHVGSYILDDNEIIRATNLIDNGGFENQNEGDVDGAILNWRAPFTAAGTVTVRGAAASEGNYGIELAHGTGTFWLDRWLTPTPPTTKPGIYKVLLDVKDGGVHGGQDVAVLDAVMHPSPWPEYAIGFDVGSTYETVGVTAPVAADRTGIDVRIAPSGTDNQSMFADNARVLDVTRGNRVVNGGFENSASRLVNWRAYSLNAGEFTFGLSSDAHSGARALRIERTYAGAGDNDAAVDLFSERIALLPGEPLEVSLWAKKLSGDADARLAVIVTEWSTTTTNQLNAQHVLALEDVGGSYQKITLPITTLNNASGGGLNIAFNVLQPDTGRHVGAYLIDDVQVIRNRVPSVASATLAYASDQTIVTVTPAGWSDADGDTAQYLYQWKQNGVAIAGATTWAITRAQLTGNGPVTCDVTAWDGIAAGNTVEATFAPSQALVIEAGRADALTVDGNPTDWDALASRVLPMSVYGQGGEDMLVNIKVAWNPTNLYFLVTEVQDDNQKEAADAAAFRAEPWMFDAISFWISFTNGPTLLNGDFNPWYGFSSTGRSDLFTARINDAATLEESAFTNAVTRTGGTAAAHNRVIEASVRWADLAAVLQGGYQPYGGLVAAVADGFTFGFEPLLIDNGFPGQSFRTGQTHVYPSGSDFDSVDVKLVPADYTLNSARHWNLFD